MTVSTLSKILTQATLEGTGLIGFVVHGWEDARAYVHAGSSLKAPVILQAGPGSREHTPLPILSKMFRFLAEESNYDVVPHLDHATDLQTCKIALDVGFTSIMFDGSKLKLSDNISQTSDVCKLAEQYNASVEAEIGYVGYTDAKNNNQTVPKEVAQFVSETNVDAIAISVGNTHLQEEKKALINYLSLMEINELTTIPLVAHGASGISPKDRTKMSQFFGVRKFNIGTELRQRFGHSLRKELNSNKTEYDRIAILSAVENHLYKSAKKLIAEIYNPKLK
jgi:fructose-bisphosphate aldolase class II